MITLGYFLILGLLLYASYTDITTMEVPLWVTPVGFGIETFVYFSQILLINMESFDLFLRILCGLLLFILSLCCMTFGNLGGADALISALIGYTLGISGLFVVLLAYLFALPYTIYLKVKEKSTAYPFVPFLTIAYICVIGKILFF